MTGREIALRVYRAALRTADARAMTRDALTGYDAASCHVLAVGKAACAMAAGAFDALGGRIAGDSFVITKHGYAEPLPGVFTCLEGGHPLPDADSVASTKAAMRMVESLSPDDRLLMLVSGGGSAIFEEPAVELAALSAITDRMMRAGADIYELNAVRRRLSRVKGGRTAARCRAPIRCLMLSDVLGDDPSVIASGPCYPAKEDDDAIRAIAEKYALTDIPALFQPVEPVRTTVTGAIIGSVKRLCETAKREAEALGLDARIVTDSLTGDAEAAALRIVREIEAAPAGACLLYGGETTVNVRGSGLGGRAQQLALACACALRDPDVTILSGASDGSDGPTDAAGGVVNADTAEEMRARGVDPDAYLANNDAYHALDRVNALLRTGPTGSNINDIVIAIREPHF